MVRYTTVEEMMTKDGSGWVCDERSLVKTTEKDSYDSTLFRIRFKIDSYFNILSMHFPLEFFTLDVVVEDNDLLGDPASRDLMFSMSWEECQARGCHGMLALALIDSSCLPNNGSRVRHSVAQFVDSLVHGLEAYYMFQRFSSEFSLNATGLWDPAKEVNMKSGYIVLAWKLRVTQGRAVKPQPMPVATTRPVRETTHNTTYVPEAEPVSNVTPKAKRRSQVETRVEKRRRQVPLRRRGRSSAEEEEEEMEVEDEVGMEEEEEEEVDDEISFKVKPAVSPVKLPEDISPTRTPTKTPTRTQAPAPLPAEVPEDIANITFGFENSEISTTPGRKSGGVGRRSTGGRKSLMPAWPEEEKSDVLTFFDHINPKETEQACIALTCKYAEMKFGQELPSKLLYQWVQKKGREVNKPAPGTSYDLPESERKEGAVNLFRSLNTDFPENKRINFTCQFFQKQYGVALTSKQLYTMLTEKGKKARSGGGRRQ